MLLRTHWIECTALVGHTHHANKPVWHRVWLSFICTACVPPFLSVTGTWGHRATCPQHVWGPWACAEWSEPRGPTGQSARPTLCSAPQCDREDPEGTLPALSSASSCQPAMDLPHAPAQPLGRAWHFTREGGPLVFSPMEEFLYLELLLFHL